MNVSLSVLALVLGCMAGCAASSVDVRPSATTMGLGDMRARDPLLDAQCRVPCTVSPGPGCC